MKRFLAFLFGAFLVGSAYAASNPAAVLTVTNIAALQALGAAAPQYPNVNVLGYYTAGDGGGGLFNWRAADTTTAEPCVVKAATAVATGRYWRQLNNNILSVLQCGAKADSSTDNSAAMQAAFNAVATYNLGEVFCPATSGNINFATTLVPSIGMVFRGQANNFNSFVGQTGNAPGTCTLAYTGSAWAIDWQTPFQSVAACPSISAPKFYKFNLFTNGTGPGTGGSGIRFNTTASAGFTDDCVAHGGGQSQVFGGVFDGVFLSTNTRGTTGIQINKAFDTTITNGVIYGYDTAIDAEGSDNLLINNNKFAFAYLRTLDLQAQGTFGNFNTVRDNTFFSETVNATDYVRTSARSGVIDANYFETDVGGFTSIINVNGCDLGQTITNNAMEIIPAYVSYWLTMTGTCLNTTLQNNYNGNAGLVPSNWNSNTGSAAFSGSGKASIYAFNNPDANNGIPFITKENVPSSTSNAPAVAGSILGTFDASSPVGIGGNYSGTIRIGCAGQSGAFCFAPVAAVGGHVTFQFGAQAKGAVDIWVLAYSSSGTTQTFAINDGVTTATVTLASGTTPTWYQANINDTVTNPVIDTYNNDTGHGQTAYILRWQVVKH